ncbi:MAG TPA: DUF4349 domain-containing protein [Candidatus Dojkabacteria bacterium]|nr:DUF4349 domain-containing protein [Candidatus Dojkabacteria bacterium]
MDKKKFFKIGGIVLLSLLGLVISFVAGIAILKHFVVGSSSSFDSREYYANDFAAPSVSLGSDSFLGDTFASKSAGISSNEMKTELAPQVETTNTSQKDKNIIKEGDLNVYADDIDATIKEIDTIAKKYQAESQNTYDSGKGISRRVNIEYRVKVNDFENFFNDLKDMDVEIGSASSGITDVTNEVIDLQARLKTYRNTEAQLLEIQKTAKNVNDTMAVYRELNNIRYEIERIESQLKYYANQTEYSTVTISVAQSNVGAVIEDDKWRPLGVLKNALRAFVTVLKGLGSVLIWLVVFGTPVVIVVLVIRYVVRKRKK